jgi:anti-anti-sigma regulatory factor
MRVAQLEGRSSAEVVDLTDGLVIRLAGDLSGEAALDGLRSALLAPRPEEVRDVIVDAAEVSAASDGALAVLWAGLTWAEQRGGRLRFSRISGPLQVALDQAGLGGELPRLAPARPARARPAPARAARARPAPAGAARARPALPMQRRAAD